MTELHELRKFVAPELVFGAGSSRLAGHYALNMGGRRILLVSDSGVAAQPWFGAIVDSIAAAGLGITMFTDLHVNPRDGEVMHGAEVYRSGECDAIVAVGGGSAMDCAKGIGVASNNTGDIRAFTGVDNVPQPGPPLVCVPTTAGSSADVSQFAIIRDPEAKRKLAIVSKAMVPDVALLDPGPTLTMNAELTRHTGLDALTHAIEAYVSNARAPLTDLLALEAVRRVAVHLPKVLDQPDNLEERTGMMLGSLYAGLAFSNAILGAVHAMAHSLGGMFDLPHGLCNAILLDHVIAYNFAAEPERYANIARALGAEVPTTADLEEKRRAVLAAVGGFKKRVGVTATLSDLGVRRGDIGGLTATAMNDLCMVTNPKVPTADDIRAVFEDAL